jgi:hypothetical protein
MRGWHGDIDRIDIFIQSLSVLASRLDHTFLFYGKARGGFGFQYAHAGYALKLVIPDWCYWTAGFALMTRGDIPLGCAQHRKRLDQFLYLTAGTGLESRVWYFEVNVFQPMGRSIWYKDVYRYDPAESGTGALSPSVFVSLGLRFGEIQQ